MNALIGLIAGLLIAGLLFYFLFFKRKKSETTITTTSTTVLEKIEKVFKVVLAEGFYSDIYDYKHEQNVFFDLIQSTKKALLIANARVLIGYDFAKVKFEVDSFTKKITIKHFPAPEILAIDPDYKFYDTENGIINKFDNDDYTAMVTDAKKRISEKALQSELPKIAAKQMKMLLSNIDDNTNWQLFYQSEKNNVLLIEDATLPQKVELQQLASVLKETPTKLI